MPLITASHLSKSHGTRVVLRDVSLALRTGERVGLVGPNGSGKSTLARLLTGLEPADSGEVVRRRDVHVTYLAQRPELPAGATAREAVLAGLGPWSDARERHRVATAAIESGATGAALEAHVSAQAEAAAAVERLGGWEREHEADALLDKLGVPDATAAVDPMSGGERRRVALARVLARRPDLAILDEPTNHLDIATIEWLETYLIERFTGALLLITHDRYVLDRVATRTLEIDRARVYSYDGGYEAYLAAKAERVALARRTEANRRRFLQRELEWLRRQPKARTGKQKARIQRIERASAAHERDHERARELRLGAQAARSGRTVLELRGLGLTVPGDTRVLVRELTLSLDKRDRIGVIGPNGCGKTTLLRALLGERPPDRGEVVFGRNTRPAYLDQGRAGLDDSKTVYDNVAAAGQVIELDGATLDVGRYLERFLFDPTGYAQRVGTLSGGERARVALARLLIGQHNLIILDEPTNDLDTDTLAAVEELLLQWPGAAIVVTHDRWFLDRVATSILAFEENGVVTHYQGNYSTYLRLAAQAAAARQSADANTGGGRARAARKREDVPAAPRPRRLTYAERLELEGLLERVDEAETRVQELEEQLADPSIYQGGGEQVPALTRALQAAREEAGRRTSRWEELEALREAEDS